MKFSTGWLRELAELPAAVTPAAMAARLTAAGLAVEGVEEVPAAGGDVALDVALDVDVTSNRVDAMCHLGVARELAALHGVALRPPVPALPALRPAPAAGLVAIAAPQLCRRYVGLVVRGVKVGPSPQWLQRRLLAIGSRPISNVVDVTNYVLWELGQPLHAFDLATLAGGRVVVREALAGESVRTLDGELRQLQPGMVVIGDAERAIALGGVMGGLDTEVTESTRDVLLEAAWFDPRAVRRMARALGMHTDASHRFERGVDPEGQLRAAERAAALLVEVAGAEVVETAADVFGEAFAPPAPIALSAARLSRFAGIAVPAAEAERLLAGVGFAVAAHGDGEWQVKVPSWRRFDVLEEADLFEEVLRLYGFDRIPPALPAVEGPDAPELPPHALRSHVRDVLAAAGYAEAIDWAFVDAAGDGRFAPLPPSGPALALVNPLSERHALMRRSLLPGLLEAASFNRRHDLPAVRLFEIGHVFWRDADGAPAEADQLAIVCGGRLGNPWERAVELDLFDLKGAVEAVTAALDREVAAHPRELPGLVPGRSAELRLAGSGEVVGVFGEVAEGAGESFPLFVAELALGPFLPLPPAKRVQIPPRLPGIEVDLTLTLPLTVSWAEVAAEVELRRAPDLVGFGLKDRYQGEGVPAGAANTTLWFHYQAPGRTLTLDEVNQRQAALAAALLARLAPASG